MSTLGASEMLWLAEYSFSTSGLSFMSVYAVPHTTQSAPDTRLRIFAAIGTLSPQAW